MAWYGMVVVYVKGSAIYRTTARFRTVNILCFSILFLPKIYLSSLEEEACLASGEALTPLHLLT